MKANVRIIALCGFLMTSLSISSCSGKKEDTPEARHEAAKRYLKVVPTKEIVDETIKAMAQNIPPNERDEFIEDMSKLMNVDTLEQVTLKSMGKTFTVEEIDALTDFYGSKVGRSAMDKYGAYMADLMPALQQEIQKALQKLQSEGKLR